MRYFLYQLRSTGKDKMLVLLAFSTLLSVGMSIARVWYTETPLFIFLNWNLFLAFLPWALTTYIVINKRAMKSKSLRFLAVGLWLLFFPNAPYILTDLFHLRGGRGGTPIWYDLVLILSFAWTGLMYGLFSLMDIYLLLRKKFKAWVVNITCGWLLFLSAYGIYLGRYLRWNSWDILTRPMDVLSDVWAHFFHPFQHPKAWGMTLMLGLLLNMIFWSLKTVTQARKSLPQNIRTFRKAT